MHVLLSATKGVLALRDGVAHSRESKFNEVAVHMLLTSKTQHHALIMRRKACLYLSSMPHLLRSENQLMFLHLP